MIQEANTRLERQMLAKRMKVGDDSGGKQKNRETC